MRKITRLAAARSRDRRVNIYLDGRYAFSLAQDVVVREGLRADQELSPDEIATLSAADQHRRCLNAAIHFIAYRPRSEYEVRQKLLKRGFGDELVSSTVNNLKEQGLIDDAAFARFWKDNRDDFSPRSRWLTGAELRRKGISGQLVEQVIGELDEDASAYRAASVKARHLPADDYPLFRRRLADHLKRRGFGYGVINDVVEKVWRERNSQSA